MTTKAALDVTVCSAELKSIIMLTRRRVCECFQYYTQFESCFFFFFFAKLANLRKFLTEAETEMPELGAAPPPPPLSQHSPGADSAPHKRKQRQTDIQADQANYWLIYIYIGTIRLISVSRLAVKKTKKNPDTQSAFHLHILQIDS